MKAIGELLFVGVALTLLWLAALRAWDHEYRDDDARARAVDLRRVQHHR